MYRSQYDQFLDSLQRMQMSLRNFRSAVAECDRVLDSEQRAALEGALDAILSELEAQGQQILRVAEARRSELAQDRAWQLLRLREIGALDQYGYYELASLCNPFVHQSLQFPEALAGLLSSEAVITDILDKTSYTGCIAGVFEC